MYILIIEPCTTLSTMMNTPIYFDPARGSMYHTVHVLYLNPARPYLLLIPVYAHVHAHIHANNCILSTVLYNGIRYNLIYLQATLNWLKFIYICKNCK